MNQQEILERLCYYDKRNPTRGDDESIEIHNRSILRSGEPCSCDNCFYGRTKLAEMILSLQPTELTSTEPEDTTAGVMVTLRQSTLQVISIGPEKELLHEIRVAPKGAWDKIWTCIKSIKSLK